jgi:hypothetical protein
VQGAFDAWIREVAPEASSSEYHAAFRSFRYGFMDGELMLPQENKDPAYQAGWARGRDQKLHA